MKSKIKVLIIDVSPTSRSIIAKYLSEDYECVTAADGEEGGEKLLQDESITLVFAAMHMPVLDGVLLLKRMRKSDVERLASIPVIIITGRADSDAAMRESYSIGATDFISKPFVKSEIRCCAGSYTRNDRAITSAESDIARDVLQKLHVNQKLSEFGCEMVAFSERHNTHTSVLFAQIVNIEAMIETYGSELMSKASESIAASLEEALREQKNVVAVGTGKYAIVIPGIEAFRANIIANRMKRVVEKISFPFFDTAKKLEIAVGITSTESSDTLTRYLTFGEYCIQAQHALNMSLDSRNNNVVRFDETYEKKVQNGEVCDPHKEHSSASEMANNEAGLVEMRKVI